MLIGLSTGVLFFISIISIIWQGAGLISYHLSDKAGQLDVFSDFTFVLSDFFLAIGILLGLIILVALIGITVFGSGIKNESVRVIIIIVAYITIWVFLTIFSLHLLLESPSFGILIYLSLTTMYLIGVVGKMSGGSSNG